MSWASRHLLGKAGLGYCGQILGWPFGVCSLKTTLEVCITVSPKLGTRAGT